MQLSGVMLNSENPKALGEFYTKVLGKPGWQDGEWYGFGDNKSSLMVGPHSEVKGKNVTPGRLMLSFTVKDVATEFERIEKLGATVVAKPYQPDEDSSPDMWLATLADPDGNYLRLSRRWGR